MTPVASFAPSEYFYWSRRAYRAATEPARIPGVLDEADRGKPVGLVEPARTPLATEGGLDTKTYEGDGANLVRVARRPQKGA